MERCRGMWLATTEGVRLPIRSTGVIIGRSPHCDVVLASHDVSRVQAIVYAGSERASLSVLGRGRTTVNGAVVEHEHELVHGDCLQFPGFRASLVVDQDPVGRDRAWQVRSPGGLFGVARLPFRVGSSLDADLRLDGPAHLLTLHADPDNDEALVVEAYIPLRVAGGELRSGERAMVGSGSAIATVAGVLELIESTTAGQPTTQLESATPELPRNVQLRFLARGGRLAFDWRGSRRQVYLPERRCDLIAALLQPPPPLAAGEFVPDEDVLPRVWPGRAMTRIDLNTLLRRARQDLARAVSDGASLLVRAEGGNATSFALAPGCAISIV